MPLLNISLMSLDIIRMCKGYFRASLALGSMDMSRLPVGSEGWKRDHVNGFILKLQHFPIPRESRCIVDVGANIGLFSKAASLYCPKAKIIALEPAAATFVELEKTVGSRALCRKAAVGAKMGTATLHVANNAFSSTLQSSNATCESLYGKEVQPTGRNEEVPVTTLAHIIEELQLPMIDLLKIDVEGFEPQVLQGAGNHLRMTVRRIMMEASLARLTFKGVLEMLGFLDTIGFVPVNINDPSRSPLVANSPMTQFDIWLVNPALL